MDHKSVIIILYVPRFSVSRTKCMASGIPYSHTKLNEFHSAKSASHFNGGDLCRRNDDFE
jgi:hypothetical protein